MILLPSPKQALFEIRDFFGLTVRNQTEAQVAEKYRNAVSEHVRRHAWNDDYDQPADQVYEDIEKL